MQGPVARGLTSKGHHLLIAWRRKIRSVAPLLPKNLLLSTGLPKGAALVVCGLKTIFHPLAVLFIDLLLLFSGTIYGSKSEASGAVQVDSKLYVQPTSTGPPQLSLDIPSYESTVENASVTLERSTSKSKTTRPDGTVTITETITERVEPTPGLRYADI